MDAVAAALGAGEQMALSLASTPAQRLEQPPPAQILDQLRQGLSGGTGARAKAEESLRLAEAIRVLALKHGTPALEHCLRLVEATRGLLDQATEER